MTTFDRLWAVHPTRNSNPSPCSNKDGVPHFENQCAIRLGVCLEEAGVNTRRWNLERCWQHKTHILRTAELAKALKFTPFPGLGLPEIYTGEGGFSEIAYRTGIIFLENYWGEDQLTGDHIDLWNGTRLSAWNSGLRLALPLHWFGAGSDMKKAERLCFWPFPAGQEKYVAPPEEDDPWDSDY